MLKPIAHFNNHSVYACPEDNFSIEQFAKESEDAYMYLILTGHNYMYSFCMIRRDRDVVQQWQGGRMQPLACLTNEAYQELLATEGMPPYEGQQKVDELMNGAMFMS